MPQFHVEEMAGETVIARHVTRAADALSAVRAVTGGQISARTDHQRWFRVVDERHASVHEFGVEEPPLRTDFAK
ncbi:hypothetical protein [Mesorhizobium sp. AA23]|uniref:hypothetical protein n=1 Tax=Mesorhizobium sp. AA23 TaxID=1854058 RepID=UPI000801DEB2|nr:hypothetical protein [Mesorhizobium sp. AA23]OBQ96263.1 hypothetical protein A9K66_21955 [Mesorhizobium sp. AA23]